MTDPNILVKLPASNLASPRLEIDEFAEDNALTNLFLLALSNLQQNSLGLTKDGKPNWMNFYAIASIHGQPQEEWNAIDKPPEFDRWGNPIVGYCHHGKNTFPTWHRPYIYLFELAVYREMKAQAAQFSGDEQTIYQNAADRFRLPYWDMIMPRYVQKGSDTQSVWGCPQLLSKDKVTIKTPTGWKIDVHNPLYSFVFPNQEEFQNSQRVQLPWPDNGPFNTSETTRVPTSEGKTQPAWIDKAIQRQAANRATMMWQMLSPTVTGADFGETGALKNASIFSEADDIRTWDLFANHRETTIKVFKGGKSFRVPSVEGWHDGIHVLMGTGAWYDGMGNSSGLKENQRPRTSGQMGDPSWAAFDPIFFLHHNNIDRFLALYQAVHPDRYCNANDANIDLRPFQKTSTTFWKSSDEYIKNYWNAGFVVPGNQDPSIAGVQSNSTVRDNIKKYLSRTYYWATNGINPKEALPDWPRDLSGSWALNGKDAKPLAKVPIAHMTALQLQGGVQKLVSRQVQLPPPTTMEKTDATVPIQAQDVPIESREVLQLTTTVDSLLPTGAFRGPVGNEHVSAQTTWNAHVKVRKFAFNGSFSVHLFTGWVKDEQPERYMTKKNEVGFTGVFATPAENMEHCSNCQAQRDNDFFIEDVIPLTTILYDYLKSNPLSEGLIRDGDHKTIDDLTPESVVPFLQEQLRWRIIDIGAHLITGQEQQAGLEITVSSRTFLPPTADNILGAYGPDTNHPEITNNKPGGFGYVY